MSFRKNTEKPAATSLLFGLILGGLFACGEPATRPVTPAFYHWQTTLALTQAECDYFAGLSCKRLYVKILDVGVDPDSKEIRPYARLEVADSTGLTGMDIVPTVFITNEVFQHLPEEKTAWLAEKILEVLNMYKDENNVRFPLYGKTGPREIQFDCDWTASTRDAFFGFLRHVGEKIPETTRLSATIRLHQYKFPKKTGVPPVERGMLMLYNTGDIEDPGSGNSIFQSRDALVYLSGAAPYPLPLDVALPAFSWILVYRDGVLWKIVSGVPERELADTTRFEPFRQPSDLFRIRRGTFMAGHYLRPGDWLRVEAVSPEVLLEAACLAGQTGLARDATAAFFHLDTSMPEHYSVQLLDSVCQAIRFPEKIR